MSVRGLMLPGLLAAALLCVFAAPLPAAADFIYVTPAGTGSGLQTAEERRSDAPVSRDAVSSDAGPAEDVTWRVEPGESLRTVLARWGGRAGVEVLMLTDRRYALGAGRIYRGSFPDAVTALLAALSHLPAAPAGELSADGRRLAVTHSSAAGAPADVTRKGAGSP